MGEPALLDPASTAAFDRDGFLVVEDALSDEELERFGPAVDRAVADRCAGDDRPLVEKTLYEQCFDQCMYLWEDRPDVRPLTFHAGLGQIAAALLGVDTVRLWQDQALYKQPGGRETDPHQDHPLWQIWEPDQVSMWIPFDGSTREGGAMAYVPGWHRIGLWKFVDISHTVDPEPYDILADPAIASVEPVWVEVPRGRWCSTTR